MSSQQSQTATQRKDRLYAQLSTKLEQLKKANMKTTDLMEFFQSDLDAMRTFAGIQAAQFMTVATGLNADPNETKGSTK